MCESDPVMLSHLNCVEDFVLGESQEDFDVLFDWLGDLRQTAVTAVRRPAV